GVGNALGRLARQAGDTIKAAASGDQRALAQIIATGTEIAGPGALLKVSGAVSALPKGAVELMEDAGPALRHGFRAASEHLPVRWTANPGSNLGNLKTALRSGASVADDAAPAISKGARELRVLNPHFTPEPLGPNKLMPRIVETPTAGEGGVYAYMKGGKIK